MQKILFSQTGTEFEPDKEEEFYLGMEQALNIGLTPNEYRKTYKKDLMMIQSIRKARNKKNKMIDESKKMMNEIKNG